MKDKLYSLASGAPVTAHIEKNLLDADRIGAELKKDFIEFRLKSSTKGFFDIVPQQKLHTMENNHKATSLTTTEGK